MANEIKKPEALKSYIMKVQETYIRSIENQFIENRIPMTRYAKDCLLNALVAIQGVFDRSGVAFNSPEIDQSSLSTVLRSVAALPLNAGVTPREVYFQLRNEKRGDKWLKKIEMGIEGDGNDRLLRNFGFNVKRVGSPWLVREGDDFEFPVYTGFETTPPTWRPSGSGKVVRVVFPIELASGTYEYLIQERDDVRPNLVAHISNNLMNETFGFAESKFKASTEQKAKIESERRRILDMIKPMTMEEILDEPSIQGWISPAWSDPQSREQMIIRKMRNNAVKKYPKDFGHALIAEAYNDTDDTYRSAQIEAEAGEGKQVIDITAEPEEASGEPEQSSPGF
jgi:hypothetical protein